MQEYDIRTDLGEERICLADQKRGKQVNVLYQFAIQTLGIVLTGEKHKVISGLISLHVLSKLPKINKDQERREVNSSVKILSVLTIT